jgi:predicted enzyme related to lactoylglutathione lyase
MEIVAVNIAETVQFLPKVMKWQLNNQTDYIQKAKSVETRSGKHLAMVQGQNDRVSIII